MKINNGYQDSRANSAQGADKAQETAATGKARSARAGAGGPAGGNDQVNLSSLASAIQGALSDSPERTAFIESLAADYESGRYQPDPKAIARGMVSDAIRSTEQERGLEPKKNDSD